LLLAAAVVVAVVSLRGAMPDWASGWAAVRDANPAWLLAAGTLQVASMTMFGEQQRRLLATFGVPMSAATALALSYTRSAMAISLPGGSALSAGYAFRQFRIRGASRPTAAAVTISSGIASVAGLGVLYAGNALVWATTDTGLACLVAAACVALMLVLAVRPDHRRADPVATPPASQAPSLPTGTGLRDRLRRDARHIIQLARSIPAERGLSVTAAAVLTWLTDLASLIAVLYAVGVPISGLSVATAYVAVQLVRQIPGTAGGIGVIEAGLLIALTAAGLEQATAAAAVLIYRVLSCWAVLPVGLLCWMAQRNTAAHDDGEREATQ
jgi:uncharacterized membrane protein YbhN (UPF0104 family)